jgi:hypothetical protein
VANAAPDEAQAVTPQMPKAPPAYKGRLRPGIIALSALLNDRLSIDPDAA